MLMHGRVMACGAAAVLLGLAGCTVGPEYQPPRAEVPEAWGRAAAVASAEGEGADEAALGEWWMSFGDPVLNSLVERAVAANLDLRSAAARVREARAQRGVARAALLPRVDAAGVYQRSRASGDPELGGPSPGAEGDLYEAGFDAFWELDVFGGVRRGVEAADAEIGAAIEDERAVLVTLLGEVAQNYIALRGTQRQAEIARANLAAQNETLEMTRSRLEAGLASDLDVARAEAQVQTLQARIPALEGSAQQAVHAISVLLALPPTALAEELEQNLEEELAGGGGIPAAAPEVPIGLPSDLLRRRPDIRRAERELAAASARIGVATAELFPRFSLTGALGVQSSSLGDLGDIGSRFWTVGPSVRWPVLDWGRIRSNIEVQSAREEQALAAYERAVLLSLREVEDALVALSQERARRRSLVSAAESNRRAVELSRELYQQGLSDFLSVLQAQRDLYAAEDALVVSDRAVSETTVALYKALGGGWGRSQGAGVSRKESGVRSQESAGREFVGG